jgi:hypothetical protein
MSDDRDIFLKAVQDEDLSRITQSLTALYKSTPQGRAADFVILIVKEGLEVAVQEDKLQALKAILETHPPKAAKLFPLRIALSRGKIEAFRKIFDSGVSLKVLEEIAKRRFDRPEILSELFARGVDPGLTWQPSKTSQKTTTLLLEAASYEALDSVRYIADAIEAGDRGFIRELSAAAGPAGTTQKGSEPAVA